MSEIAFSNNYSDLSESTGFQFEFRCQRCGDAWRTEFKRYGASAATSLLDTASSFLGGILGNASRVADQIRDAGYKTAHDKAFEEAVEHAKEHFHRCRRCAGYFCAQCYNPNLNLCVNCAPSVEEEANVAGREKEIELARERAQKAAEAGQKTDGNVVCSNCHARVKPAKFCSECGEPLVVAKRCRSCDAELQDGAKFCPECGAKQ